MVGGGSIGRNEVLVPEGGGGVTGILVHFIYISDRCKLLKIIKCLLPPSKKGYLFSVRSQRSSIKPVVLQFGLVYKEDKDKFGLVSLPWLQGVHLRPVLWSVRVPIVRWGTMGPNTGHPSWRLASLCSC